MLNLTLKQLELLYEVLENTTDEGPVNEGWKSTELNHLVTLVHDTLQEERAIQEGRNAHPNCR